MANVPQVLSMVIIHYAYSFQPLDLLFFFFQLVSLGSNQDKIRCWEEWKTHELFVGQQEHNATVFHSHHNKFLLFATQLDQLTIKTTKGWEKCA